MMALSSLDYLTLLRAYVNKNYVVDEGSSGDEVTLTEKYFQDNKNQHNTRCIKLLLPGNGFVLKLDHDQVGPKGNKHKPPLFHFLDDNAKPWSKRCDFVIFYAKRKTLHADCIEFKSNSLMTDTIRHQLGAGTCWVKTLKKIVEYYAGYKPTIHLRKFVFGSKKNPNNHLNCNQQFNADPSIRYYNFGEVKGRSLAELQNDSSQRI